MPERTLVMKKVLLTITSWIPSEKRYLDTIIDAYGKFRDYKCDIFLSVNYPYETKEEVVIVPTTFKGVVHTWACHQVMADNYQYYDLIVSVDADILLTEENLDFYVRNQSLSMDYIPGYLVYEELNNVRAIVSMRMCGEPPVEDYLIIGGERWIVPSKKHSACFVADKERYGIYLGTGHGIKPEADKTLNMQAMARTGIYLCGKFKKVVSINGVRDGSTLVRHLPSKYMDQTKYAPIRYLTPDMLTE